MKLVILDRDGVINYDSDEYIKTVDEWQIIPGSAEAIGRLTKAGFDVCVATNQSGLSRRYFDIDTLHQMHEKMISLVESEGGRISKIEFCPHGPDDGCECRKPKEGMLLHILCCYPDIDPSNVCVVGDSLRDLESAIKAGCKPLLVKTGKGLRTLAKGGLPEGTQIFDDLADAAAYICHSQTIKTR